MFTKCPRGLATLSSSWKFMACLPWLSLLLLLSAATAKDHGSMRSLTQAGDANPDDWVKVVDNSNGWRPFLALKNTATARSNDVQRLYEQSGQGSAIAYLLFAAALPLSQAAGSSNALLPYLTPTVMRLWMSQPGRCSSPLAEDLYDLSQQLYGSQELQACHYSLYTALGSTFAWVRDNIALRVQELPDQPLASAAWPDTSLYSDRELAAAVAEALAHPDKLGETVELVAGNCGLAAGDFAALVPPITAVLQRLHADLPLLQNLAENLHAAHWKPVRPVKVDKEERRRRFMLQERLQDRFPNPQHLVDPGVSGFHGGSGQGAIDGVEAAAAAAAAAAVEDEAAVAGSGAGDVAPAGRRRSALTLPANFQYSFPPSNFVNQQPGLMPALSIPLVFHIMLYQDGSGIGPTNYDKSVSYMQRLVDVANYMAKPASVQFFIKEVRNDPNAYPYLLLPDRATWLKVPLQNCTGSYCFSNAKFMYKNVVDFPRSINIFIASDSTAGVPLGYAYVPGSDLYPDSGHAFVSWDSASTDGANSLLSFNDGPNTLLHELFHHLGLQHPFDYSWGPGGACVDGDYVIDTPASMRPISSSSFYSTAASYCMELFWGQYGGDWDATYIRWSSMLGIPDADMNAWADTCPALAGYDELGNYMTYNTPVCFAAVGHFTAAQAQRAMYMTAELNPVMYAWGQYYAQNSEPPPPMASPPPEFVNNTCRATARSACACKSSWSLSGVAYSYCDRIWSNNTLSCEVQNPSSCADCAGVPSPCILPCAGSPRICKRPPAPGTRMPPPPPPRPPSPPPKPPPPPPRAVPTECKKASSGCECRSSWSYQTGFYSYCARPDMDTRLWCQVTSTCPSFNNSNPYQYCASSLNTSYCGGRIYFTTTRVPPTPPDPPDPPPDLRPRPPPTPPSPPVGPVATVGGTFTINSSCALLSNNYTDLRNSVLKELAQALSVPYSYINVTSMTCGPIVVAYLVSFPAGATITQVNSAAANAQSFSSTVSSTFTSRWGAVTKSSSSGVEVLQPNAICMAGPDGASYCPPPAALPPPSQKKAFPWLWVLIGAGVGGVVLIAVVVAVVCVATRRARAVVAPEPPQPHQQQQRRAADVVQAQQYSPGAVAQPVPHPGAMGQYPAHGYGPEPVQYYQQPAYPPSYNPPPPYTQQPYPQQPYLQQPYR